ncbi:XRE family transcriptional regulator [Sphingobium sp.]|uniref:XRE family transcriptional regulator n=1 Tax=Sphingobium sp. TaxID=1912891 RepID=UPI00257954FC|nr:XRE family transcriptional regulator [Sphingobium sp.]
MASALDMPLGTYSAYESSRYKKPLLPLDFARRVAAVLAQHKVDPAEVMKLAGLNGEEAEPEAREIEAQRPAFVSITLPVILPSEVALRDMFRSLLVLVPEGATKDEAAAILARRLPTGLAACGPLSLDQATVASLGGGEAVQSHATDHRGSLPPSRI